jgi:hypothetical protein
MLADKVESSAEFPSFQEALGPVLAGSSKSNLHFHLNMPREREIVGNFNSSRSTLRKPACSWNPREKL